MIAEVIVDILHSNLDKTFDYLVPDNLEVNVGDFVTVPFGNQEKEGYVLNFKETSTFAKLKEIKGVKNSKILSHEKLSMAFFVKEKYHCLLAESLKLFLPPFIRDGSVKEKTEKIFTLAAKKSEILPKINNRSKAQLSLLSALDDDIDYSYGVLLEKGSSQTIKTLVSKGFLTVWEERSLRTPYDRNVEKKEKLHLTPAQKKSVQSILSTDKLVTLIHGVTGSGKTEVYLTAIEETVERGRDAIFLVPEIALTPQMLSKLREKFGEKVAILHSGLSSGERYDEWWRLKNGEAKIAVGARSAIFAPLDKVGIFIIDEEHETTYLSESSPRYSTREIAIEMAKRLGGKVILGSATPSLESFDLALKGDYNLISMTERINAKRMPKFKVVDMRQQIKMGNPSILSVELQEEMEKALKKGQQVMLFLNRRGFSTIYQCLECGFVCQCDSCDISLTYHKSENMLKCHYCGGNYAVPKTCPTCGSTHFKMGKNGTEKVAFEVLERFPNAKVARMDNDTTKTKESHLEILEKFKNKDTDVLVGTQMIAKGHDFENVTLVGILDGDMSLYHQDYRSGERTFQLITQVAGRAGRGDKEGKVILQTYNPTHHILNFALNYDYKSFFEYELALRQTTSFPPFSTILRLLVYGSDEERTRIVARKNLIDLRVLKKEHEDEIFYLNGMKSPIAKINNNLRLQILIRAKSDSEIIEEVYKICDKNKDSKVISYVEINPTNLS